MLCHPTQRHQSQQSLQLRNRNRMFCTLNFALQFASMVVKRWVLFVAWRHLQKCPHSYYPRMNGENCLKVGEQIQFLSFSGLLRAQRAGMAAGRGPTRPKVNEASPTTASAVQPTKNFVGCVKLHMFCVSEPILSIVAQGCLHITSSFVPSTQPNRLSKQTAMTGCGVHPIKHLGLSLGRTIHVQRGK